MKARLAYGPHKGNLLVATRRKAMRIVRFAAVLLASLSLVLTTVGSALAAPPPTNVSRIVLEAGQSTLVLDFNLPISSAKASQIKSDLGSSGPLLQKAAAVPSIFCDDEIWETTVTDSFIFAICLSISAIPLGLPNLQQGSSDHR